MKYLQTIISFLVFFNSIQCCVFAQSNLSVQNSSMTYFSFSVNDTIQMSKANRIDDKHHTRYFMGMKSHRSSTKYNPLTYALGGLMFFYQNVVSPQVGGIGCPYYPSCSEFSKQSIEKFGLIKGVFLSADRFSRCTNGSLSEMQYVKIDSRSGLILNNPDEYKFNKR